MSQVYGLRWVPRATMRPHRCAVISHIGSSSKGFFDTQTDFFGDRVYVSVDAAELMATSMGWESPTRVKAREETERDLRQRVTDLEEQLREADRELSAIEVLKQRRYETPRTRTSKGREAA